MIAGMAFFVFRVAHSGRSRLMLAAEMILAFILARGIMTSTISALVGRSRPFEALGFTPPFMPITSGAFPSGHMAGLFAVAFVMITFDTRWGLAYFALSLLVGLARIFTGVHWPSDILGGIAVGLLGGWAVHLLVMPAREALGTGPSPGGIADAGGGPPDPHN
jgi:undecaprenyl-diphosphatase